MFETLVSFRRGSRDRKQRDREECTNQQPNRSHASLTATAAATAPSKGQQVRQVGDLIEQHQQLEAVDLVLATWPPSAAWVPAAGKLDTDGADASVHVGMSTAAVSCKDHEGPEQMQQQRQLQKLQEHERLWQAHCVKLQHWAMRALQQACPDLSMSAIQWQLLRQAALQAWGKPPQAWSRLCPGPNTSKGCELATAVFKLAPSRQQAWACLSRVLWHGLALDIEGHFGQGVGHDDHSSDWRPHSHHWLPQSATKRVTALQAKQPDRVKEVLASFPCSATLGIELIETSQVLLPRTYLQLVGQKLLGQAVTALPVLQSLPEVAPEWVLRSLFTAPFADALRLALSDIVDGAATDASPYIPQLLQPARKGDFKRVYPLDPANSNMSFTAASAPSQMALTESSRSLMVHGGSGAVLGVLACVCRDVQEFEAGLLMATAQGNDSNACLQRLAAVLTRDLQAVLLIHKRQLQELVSRSTMQLLMGALQEELQQPLSELLQSAADVVPSIWPPLPASLADDPTVAGDKLATAVSESNYAAGQAMGKVANNSKAQAAAQVPDWQQGISLESGQTVISSIFGENSLLTIDADGNLDFGPTGRRALYRHMSSEHGTEGPNRAPAMGVVPWSNVHHQHRGHRASAMAMLQGGFVGMPQRRSRSSWTGGLDPRQSQSITDKEAAVQDLDMPVQMTQAQRQLLVFAGAYLTRLQQFPLLLQGPVVLSMLKALEAVLNHTSSNFAGITLAKCEQDPISHICCCISMVLCIQRRLLWLKEEWEPKPPGDEVSQQASQLLQGLSEQAGSLVQALQDSLAEHMLSTHNMAVLTAVSSKPWGSSRGPLRSASGTSSGSGSGSQAGGVAAAASPGARLWHMLLQAWQCTVRRVLPPNMAVQLMGQVALHTASSLVPQYLSVKPSAAWLPVLQQDMAVIATTAWELSQPWHVQQQQQQQQRQRQTGSSQPQSRHTTQSASQLQVQSSIPSTRTTRRSTSNLAGQQLFASTKVRGMSEKMIRQLSDLCKQLVLHCAQVASSSGIANGARTVHQVSAKTRATAAADALECILETDVAESAAIYNDGTAAAAAAEGSDASKQLRGSPASGDASSKRGSEQSSNNSIDKGSDSWDWVGAELLQSLQSRVLGQQVPCKKLLYVARHAGIGTGADSVNAEAWLVQGWHLLAQEQEEQ